MGGLLGGTSTWGGPGRIRPMTTTRKEARPRRRARLPKLPKNVVRHGSKFRVEMVIDGKTCRSKTVATVEEAERLRDSMRRWKPGTETLTLDAAIELLRDDLRRKGTTAGTLRFYEGEFARLLEAWDGSTALVRIDRRDREVARHPAR